MKETHTNFTTNDRKMLKSAEKHADTSNFEGAANMRGIASIDSRVGRLEGSVDGLKDTLELGFEDIKDVVVEIKTSITHLPCDKSEMRISKLENSSSRRSGIDSVYDKIKWALLGAAISLAGSLILWGLTL